MSGPRHLLAALAAPLVLTACITPFSYIVATPTLVKNYEVGAERSAAIGEPIFRVQQARSVPMFVAQREIALNGLRQPIAAGSRFFASTVDANGSYRLSSLGNVLNGGTLLITGDGLQVTYLRRDYVRMGTALSTDTARPLFRRVTEVGDQPGAYTAELVYSGVAGNVLRAVYREYVDQLARPAFSQELQYDLTGDRTIQYRSVKIRVADASNSAVRYTVTDDGGLPWLPQPRPLDYVFPAPGSGAPAVQSVPR